MAASSDSRNSEAGVIRAGEMYTVAAAMQRLGLGQWGWRQLRRQGLRIMRSNGRAFVYGDDLIAHLRSRNEARIADKVATTDHARSAARSIVAGTSPHATPALPANNPSR